MPFTFTEDDFTEAPPDKTADQAVDELAPPSKPVGPPKFTFEESDFLPPEQKPWAMAKEKIASAFDFSGGPLEFAKKVAKFATPTMPSAAYEDFQSLKEHAKSLFDQEAPTSPMARQPLAEMGISPENVPSGAEIAGAAKTGPLSVPAVAQTVSATGKMVAGLADWMTSPKGQEQMAAFEVPGLNVAMAAKFLYQMANQGWLQAEKAGEAAYVAYRTGDPDAQQAVADNLIGSIASFAGAGLVGAGAAAKAEPKTFNPQGLRGAERDALAKKVKDELQSIKEAGKANITPEQKAFWGRINAEVAGTTDAKVAEYAKSLGMDWSPIKAPGEEAPPEAPAAPTPTPPPGPPPAPPAEPPIPQTPVETPTGTAITPAPPAPTTPGPPSAETIRGDQGLIPPTGQVGEGGQEVGGNDLQQPPPGPPNAPAPPETQSTEAEVLLKDLQRYDELQAQIKANSKSGKTPREIFALNHELNQEVQNIKNRYGGKVPKAPTPAAAEPKPLNVPAELDKLKGLTQDDLVAFRGKFGGGGSALADEVGASARTQEDLDAILAAYQHFLDLAAAAKKSGDMDARMLAVNKSALAREAYEMATGHMIGDPTKEGGALTFVRQKFPDYQAPMAPKKAGAVVPEPGSPADKFGSVYGPNIGAEGYNKLKAADVSEPLSSEDPSITFSLQTKNNKLWLTAERKTATGKITPQAVAYLHSQPDGTTILSGSFAHPQHADPALAKLAKDRLVQFINEFSAPKKAAAPAEKMALSGDIQALIASQQNAQQKAAAMASLAKKHGMTLKDFQETVEAQSVAMAHQAFPRSDKNSFDAAVVAYNNQPILSARTSTSVEQQAYSTPAPISVGINHALGVTPQTPILDNSGGNGMMLIGGDLSKSHAIELNPKRAENLKKLGVGNVTEGDALKIDVPQKQFPVVKVNPAFGPHEPVLYNGYKITRLDHLLALRALEGMKDDGKAALVMGAKMFEGEHGQGAQWVFENYVYGHYNVVGNFEISGDLYAKQGAKWPVRIIFIDGRRAQPIRGDLGPKTVARVTTWDEAWAEFSAVRDEIESRRSTLGTPGFPTISVRPPGPPGPPKGPGIVPQPPNRPTGTPVGPVVGGGIPPSQLPPGPRLPPGSPAGPTVGPVSGPGNLPSPAQQPAVGGHPPTQLGGGLGGPATTPANVPGTRAPSGGGLEPGIVPPKSNPLDAKAGDLSELSDSDLDAILDEASGEPPKPAPAPPTSLETKTAPTRIPPKGMPEWEVGKTPPGKVERQFRILQHRYRNGTPAEKFALDLISDLEFGTRRAGFDFARQGITDEAASEAFDRLMKEGGLAWSPDIRTPQPPKPPGPPRPPKGPPGPPQPPKKPPTPKDAGLLGGKGLESTMDALNELFGGGTMMLGGIPVFNEETYAKAKPHFEKAWQEFKAAGKTLVDWAKALLARFGEAVRGYLKRFMQDEKAKDQTPKPKEEPSEHQVPYKPLSRAGPFGTLVPKGLADAIHAALADLGKRRGDIDQWLADKLHLTKAELLDGRFAAEQVDGTAMAIDQMETGGAAIIGDETGIGKGRQGAGGLRYAEQNEKLGLFFTADPKLFTDMYRDLKNIGTISKPFIMGDKNAATIKDTDGNVLVQAPDLDAQNREIERIMKVGWENSGYNMLFATYSQVNEQNNRQAFLQWLAEKYPTVIVMDEAHKAAGDNETSMSAAFFSGGDVKRKDEKGVPYKVTVPGILNSKGTKMEAGGGVMYMSATFAKRADNMPVYFRTSISKAADSFDEIVNAMKSGGNAMQQAVSEALAKAGQYIRRERSFAGVSYHKKEIVPDDLDTLRDHVDQVTDVLSELVLFSKEVKKAIKQNLRMTGTAMSETQMSATDFASIVHNQVSQLLLAAKADNVVQEAVDASNRGEKPLVALTNTMESFMTHWAEDNNVKSGQKITLRWNELLKYALDSQLRAKQKHATGLTDIVHIDPDDIGLGDRYREILAAAEGIESKFPVSPIDYIIQKLKNKGIEMLELTGRQSWIEYTDFEKGEGIYRKFRKADKNFIVEKFNNTRGTGLVLNASGSTGLNAHASEHFKDQSPRHMIVAQPSNDINIFVQTLGRIFRTGMVLLGIWPDTKKKYGARYTHLVLPIQAEMRPAALTEGKMKSLNANTTSETSSKVKIDAADIMNRYGDRIVAEYLSENLDLANRLNIPVERNSDGSVRVKPGVARQMTGRMAIRPDAEQARIYNEILPAYRELIEQLKATGEYDLEVVVHDDWDGTLQENQELAPGTDESNIFTASTRAQRWEVLDKRHTPTEEEMRAEFIRNLKGEAQLGNEWRAKTEAIRKSFEDRKSQVSAIIAELSAKEPRTPKDAIDLMKAQARATQLDEAEDRWNNLRKSLHNVIYDAGSVVEFTNEKTGEIFDGMIVNMSLPSEPTKTAPSNFKFRAMVNVPGGTLHFTGTDLVSGNITKADSDKTLEDLQGRHRETRGDRWFITGNPIKAVRSTGGVGKVTRFGTRAKDVVTGLLMPRNWSMGKLAEDPRIELINGQTAKFYMDKHGGVVELPGSAARVGRDWQGRYLITTRAASKRASGAIYLDKELRKIIDQDFTLKGGRWQALVQPDKIEAAMNRINQITSTRFRAAGDAEKNIPKVQDANRLGRPPTSGGGGIGGGIKMAMEHGRFGSESGSIYLGGVDEFIKRDVGPLLKKGVDAAKAMTDIIIDAFSPAIATATEDVDILFKSKGDKEKVMTRAAANLDKAKKAFDKMPQAEQIAFIDRVKRGIPQPTPDLEFVAKLLRKWDDRLIAMVHRFKPDLNYLDNHYRVLWKVVPGSPQAMGASVGGIKGKRPYQGTKGFLRRHVLEDMSEGIALGGVPISYNPIEMFLLHAEDVMKYVAANRAWEGLKKTGSVVWVKNGEQRPTGYVQISDKIAKPYFRTQQGLLAKSGEWYVEEGAARMLENYLSKDHIRTGKFGPIGRVLLGLKNATTAIELGLSPFHAVFESNEVIGSSIGLGIAKLASGKIAQGLKDIATAPFTPKTTSKIGKMAIQYAKNPAEFARVYPEAYKWFTTKYPEARRMINDLFTGGGQVSMNEDYRLKGIQGFRRSIAEGNYPGAVVRAFPALSELAMNPMFNTWIPRLKVGMFLREYAFELERNNARLAAGRITRPELARKTWAFIEDRFGELNFDNLYWDRTFKSAMQILFRSVTWKLGNVRGFGKAGRDAWAEGLRPLLTGKVPRVTLPMAWLAGMAFVTAFLASVISKVSTDEYPWELAGDATDLLRNLVFPRIDKDDPRQRVSVPTYWRDLAHLIHSPVGYVGSSMTGEWRRMYDDLVNKDFYGHPIYNPNSPVEKKAFDSLVHLIPQPFGLSSFIGAKQEGVSTEKATAGFMGFTKAPAYISPNPRTQVREMILKWKTQTGVPKLVLEAQRAATEEIEPSAYVPLRTALRNNNYEVARKELVDLIETGHAPKDIKKTMNPLTQQGKLKPLTGRVETEKYFLQSLTPNEKEIYKEALRERFLIYARFNGVLAASGINN